MFAAKDFFNSIGPKETFLTKVETRAAWGKRTRSSRSRELPTTIPTKTVATNAQARMRRKSRI